MTFLIFVKQPPASFVVEKPFLKYLDYFSALVYTNGSVWTVGKLAS